MLKRITAILLLTVLLISVTGCGAKYSAQEKAMYEKLYQVTKGVLAPYEHLYQAISLANDYTNQYLKNPTKEALEQARIATVAAVNLTNEAQTQSLEFTEEELSFYEEHSISIDGLALLGGEQYTTTTGLFRNAMTNRNYYWFANIHLSDSRELLNALMPSQHQNVSQDADGTFLAVNGTFLGLPEELQDEYAAALAEQFPTIFSNRFSWAYTEENLKQNYDILVENLENSLNDESYLVGMSQGSLDNAKQQGYSIVVEEALSHPVPFPYWISIAEDRFTYAVTDAATYPETRNQLTVKTASVDNDQLEEYVKEMDTAGYQPSVCEKNSDGTIRILQYEIGADVLTVTRDGDGAVFCSDVNEISLVAFSTVLYLKGMWNTQPVATPVPTATPSPTPSVPEDGYQELQLSDGASYHGELKNGIFHGYGILTLSNGTVYEGEFQNGELNGKGTRTTLAGDYYEGDFKDGVFHGNGELSLASGSHYAGEFYEGDMTGEGTYHFYTGSVYQGTFLEGILNGQGTYISDDGDVYEGTFSEGMLHGTGKVTYADGDTYQGEWQHGRPHGKGITHYSDGDTYEGEFQNGHRHGYGVYLFSDGGRYEGEFYEGDMSGTGTMTSAAGDIYEGEWNNGQPEGQGKTTLANGNTHEGGYLAGERHGYGVYLFANGDRYEGEFLAHKYHGYGVFTGADGTVQAGIWEEGNFIAEAEKTE